jgi:predicted 3-demethylubiquinone-9 3-methyltransferase (glyoxalase superfamily)
MTRLCSKIAPCLWFSDQAEEAAKFYTSILPNSHIDHVQMSLTDYPGGKEGAVLVVEFTLGGQRFLALNGGQTFEYTHAISLAVECDTQEEVDRLWDQLGAGGQIEQCGWLRDKFGVYWQITPSLLPKLLAGEPAKAKRAMAAMMQMVKLDIAALQKAYDGG